MTQPNDANHELARLLVASGAWRVDPAAGLVFGKRGLPLLRANSWGYIQIKFRDPEDWRRERSVLAHRVIWEAVHGPLGVGLTINHKNGIKTDNRLDNLEAISQAANARHAWGTGLQRPVKGVDKRNAKLTEAVVRDLYLRCSTERCADLAREYGVSHATVSHIKHGRSWTHVTGASRGQAEETLSAR